MKTIRLAYSSLSLAALMGCQELTSLDLAGPANTTKGTDPAEVEVPGPADPVVAVDDSDAPGRDPGLRLSSTQIRSLYSDTSCTGLGGNPTGGPITDIYNRGLRGKVTVPTVSNASSWNRLSSFLTPQNQVLDTTLFFGDLNVPTRAFSAGFPKLGGGLVQDAMGNTLNERFRIDFDGFVELAPGMADGDYEFALLADDGVELKLGGASQTYLKDDSVFPTKMVCSDQRQAVSLHQGHTLPLKLAYFQGPRYHIALVMLWREYRAQEDSACGNSGNDTWFDSSKTPSEPKSAYNALISRGWSVVPASAYRIPDDELMNPCRSEAVQDEFQDANPI